MEKICGIYCVENLINHHKYVGLSKDCHRRWQDHFSKSYCSKKEEDIKKPLYMTMRKYGRENFSFRILEECSLEELKNKEIYWISELDTYHNGYNATPGGDLIESTPLKGENRGMAKLTQSQVESCRIKYQQGFSSRETWEKSYSNIISYSGFQRMWHGKTWKNVMPEVFEKNPRPKKKISEEEIIAIKHLFKDGKSCAEVFHLLDEKYSRTTINDIFNERQYKEIN